MNKKGFLITFEGPEGCGKSTHSRMLKKHLESLDHDVVLTFEPGGTNIGKKIREVLIKKAKEELSSLAEIMLFIADRAEHVEKVIKPALKEGKVVICDRFIDSTIAYQIGGRGLPEDLVRYLNSVSIDSIFPDLTILLDIDSKIGLKRAKDISKINDRFENQALIFHKNVRDKYLQIAKNEPERVKIISSSLAVEEVQNKIRKIVEDKLKT